MYPAYKEDGGVYWSSITTAYAAFEKGVLPVYGGMDDQPAKFATTMAILSAALAAEQELQREDDARNKGSGKESITERYLSEREENHPTPTHDNHSPDGLASVPGLLTTRTVLKRS